MGMHHVSPGCLLSGESCLRSLPLGVSQVDCTEPTPLKQPFEWPRNRHSMSICNRRFWGDQKDMVFALTYTKADNLALIIDVYGLGQF